MTYFQFPNPLRLAICAWKIAEPYAPNSPKWTLAIGQKFQTYMQANQIMSKVAAVFKQYTPSSADIRETIQTVAADVRGNAVLRKMAAAFGRYAPKEIQKMWITAMPDVQGNERLRHVIDALKRFTPSTAAIKQAILTATAALEKTITSAPLHALTAAAVTEVFKECVAELGACPVPHGFYEGMACVNQFSLRVCP